MMKFFRVNRKIKSFENNKFERLVSISLILAFMAVIITGALSFTRLNGIISTVDKTIHPDRSLNVINDIYNDLILAENYVRSYNIRRNEADMSRYTEQIDSTRKKIEDLKEMVKSEKSVVPYVDTLEALADEKFDILDMLVVIKDEYPVEDAMEGFMHDILSEAKADSARGNDAPTTDEIARKIAKEQESARMEYQQRKSQELEWVNYDKVIMARARSLIANLESRKALYLKETIKMAEEEASETKMIIFIFGLASLLLLLLAGTVIFLYARRNNEYRLILKKARNDAEDLAFAKQRFLANMSHEIKTPMNVISGYLGQILQSPLEIRQREQLEIVKKSSDHLLHLLNNLLDMSKLQANKLDLLNSEFSPAEIIDDMKRWFTPAAGEKDLQLVIELAPEIPLKITGDPVRIRQVLANLTENAIKFTDKGKVILRAYTGKADNNRPVIIFEVADTGTGIAKADLDNIFSEFGRGNSLMAIKSEGAGLGLAISSKLVALMGGILKVTSTPGEGSVFTAEIPFSPVKEIDNSGSIAPSSREEALNGLTVLVVDDEAYNRGLLKIILEKHGCVVLEATGGAEALAITSEARVDIILMDIRMPGMSGPEAARQIRKSAGERGTEIPVIALSAAISQEGSEIYRESGILDFLDKPFKEEQLLNAITRLVRGGISSFPGYDLGPLKESCGGNTAFFKEMIDIFLKSTDAGLSEMEGQLLSGALSNVSGLAHKLSSPCRHLKADVLHSLLNKIEKQAVADQNQEAESTLIKARLEFERIKADILANAEFNTR